MSVVNPVPASPTQWRDVKRYWWWLSTLPPLAPLTTALTVVLTGQQLFWWSGLLVLFGLGVVVDLLVGDDRSNPPEDVVSALEGQRYYRWVVYMAVPAMLVSMIVVAWFAAGGVDWIIGGGLLRFSASFAADGWVAGACRFVTDRMLAHGSLRWFNYVGMAVSTGVATGISINTAHELGHKPKRHEQWLAKLTLAPTCYGHFYTEHNRGHHVRVATPEDPALPVR